MSYEGIECANPITAQKYRKLMEDITESEVEIVLQTNMVYLVKLKQPVKNERLVQNRIIEWLANHPGKNELGLTDEECQEDKI
jgi:hypothetical protein